MNESTTDKFTKIYFVRHAQPDFSVRDDSVRPLTSEGLNDTRVVLETLKDKKIDVFLCSPLPRSIETIKSTAEFYGKEIIIDERFMERKSGSKGNTKDLIYRRWQDRNWHEDGGESLNSTQVRNVEALTEVLDKYAGKNIVIGTHGTALSLILNHYYRERGFDDFMRIIDWMPYVIEAVFDGQKLLSTIELAFVYKEFKK